jgi:hypothetical protein
VAHFANTTTFERPPAAPARAAARSASCLAKAGPRPSHPAVPECSCTFGRRSPTAGCCLSVKGTTSGIERVGLGVVGQASSASTSSIAAAIRPITVSEASRG